ncbi:MULTISPECIES: hypothetical protein [Desulfosporosinus]|nr:MULTISPECIES: hypothetical protein [Desulfosporosinus]
MILLIRLIQYSQIPAIAEEVLPVLVSTTKLKPRTAKFAVAP